MSETTNPAPAPLLDGANTWYCPRCRSTTAVSMGDHAAWLCIDLVMMQRDAAEVALATALSDVDTAQIFIRQRDLAIEQLAEKVNVAEAALAREREKYGELWQDFYRTANQLDRERERADNLIRDREQDHAEYALLRERADKAERVVATGPLAALKAGLKFYADPENWQKMWSAMTGATWESRAEADRGYMARYYLELAEERTNEPTLRGGPEREGA